MTGRGRGWFRLTFAAALIAFAGGFPLPPIGPDSAHAQERRPTLFDLFFGGGLFRPPQFQPPSRDTADPAGRNRRQRADTSRPAGNSAPARRQTAPPEPVIAKDKDAHRILVLGDFMADSLHWGLEQTYAQNPKAAFVAKPSGLSGLVRDDVLDWPAAAAQYIQEIKPVGVVILVGMNDRQEMRIETGNVPKLSDEWRREYERRTESLVNVVRERNLPLIWVGLPPVRSGSMNTDYLVFNEIYRTKVEAAGGSFVDVWDGFTNADGAYIAAGPDISGQIVRLRNSDGINMTNAGKRKLAFYAEREIRKVTGMGSDPETSALPGIDSFAIFDDPSYDPAATGRTIVMALDDPMAEGGAQLEGEEGFLETISDYSTSYSLVVLGQAAFPHEGRIDNGWGPPAPMERREPEIPPDFGFPGMIAIPSGPR